VVLGLDMNLNAKDHLADRVQRATAELLLSLSCSHCGGGLNVQFTPRGKGALSVLCSHCPWRVVRDGIPTEPPWVRELGSKVQTIGMPAATEPRR
jgi:hypothetical protein